MRVEELNQEKDEIEKKIKILEKERDVLLNRIEEQSVLAEDEIEITRNESFNTLILVMSFLGIFLGVVYMIYFKTEGVG